MNGSVPSVCCFASVFGEVGFTPIATRAGVADRAVGVTSGVDAGPSPGCRSGVGEFTDSTVAPELAGPAGGPEPTCTVPIEPLDSFPPPTCAVPSELYAVLPLP